MDKMDLAYRVLDDQLVDVDGRRCGRADDLEFDGDLGSPPRLYGMLSGRGVWWRRLPRPLRGIGKRMLGPGVVGEDVIRVPWDQVDHLDTVVHLKGKARDLGLGQGDDHLAHYVAKLPKS